MAFIVENGTVPNKYRSWDDMQGGFCWTESRDEAIQYARRKDAELVHAEDIDACFIREIDELGVLPAGPWRAENIGFGWSICLYHIHKCQAALSVSKLNMTEIEEEIFCRVCAAALNRTQPVLTHMRAKHEELIAHLLAANYETVITVQQPRVEFSIASVEEIANNITPIKLLHLLQEFCVANATQWKIGANDHHHPIWGMTAQALSGFVPITEGPDWAFIQPTNRTSLEDLHKKVTHGD